MPSYMLTALSKLLFGSEHGNSSVIFKELAGYKLPLQSLVFLKVYSLNEEAATSTVSVVKS